MVKKEILQYLDKNNFVPSKKMGQNFLINDAIKKNIVTSSNITKDDNVLEIGPGLGAITKYICKVTDKVIAIELDKRLAEIIRTNFPQVELINNDILKVDLNDLLKEKQWSNVKVVANLPYSISSKIILKLIQIDNISEINILIQKEMAQRLLAKKNTKDYNAFTILVSLFASVEVKIKVGKNEFVPAPEVESWFISIKKHKQDIDFDKIDRLLRIAFSARRKKLTSNLSNIYPKNSIIDIFKEFGWSENLRAEDLSKEDFVKLFNSIEK
ncbi:MAG: 16S rRNA (adenine(1518)-N(6)/adenine(1519)-N(6))-dimethyltransferase RsmA [Mycoplasma sp.]